MGIGMSVVPVDQVQVLYEYEHPWLGGCVGCWRHVRTTRLLHRVFIWPGSRAKHRRRGVKNRPGARRVD